MKWSKLTHILNLLYIYSIIQRLSDEIFKIFIKMKQLHWKINFQKSRLVVLIS